jgi:hypothetical protein
MSKINSGTGRVFAGVAGALALAAIFSGCVKQEEIATAPAAEANTQVVAQADIPEVIVTASRGEVVARR